MLVHNIKTSVKIFNGKPHFLYDGNEEWKERGDKRNSSEPAIAHLNISSTCNHVTNHIIQRKDVVRDVGYYE